MGVSLMCDSAYLSAQVLKPQALSMHPSRFFSQQCHVGFVSCALQSGCTGGGTDPKPPKGLLGRNGNDTGNR